MSKLYTHVPHPHRPQNTNVQRKEEMRAAGFNQRLAVAITRMTGTMTCAYAFGLLALLGFPALSALFSPIVAIYVVWFSQTFLQLIFLPVLSVGQSVLNRKAELQADEQFNTTIKTYHDIEQIALHLDKQDSAILQILEKVEQLMAVQAARGV